jgi:hypothetical protein
MEIRKYLQLNNDSTINQNLWDTIKVLINDKIFIALNNIIMKQKRLIIIDNN